MVPVSMREANMPMPGAWVGVNFSNTFQSQPIGADYAVNVIRDNKVSFVKTFGYRDRDLAFIQAAHGSKALKLAVGIPNSDLQDLAGGNTSTLINAIKPYADAISWLCVGNEPLASWNQGKYNNLLVNAITNVTKAVKDAGLSILVTIPHSFDFLKVSYPPSDGSIKDELIDIMLRTCAVMQTSGSPFMVNIYPFLAYKDNPSIPLDYCLFNGHVEDKGLTYTNILYAMIDAVHWALKRLGYDNLELVIGECGWPTQGHAAATPVNAEKFNYYMIRAIKSYGTPLYEKRPIRCFLFEMFDEDLKDEKPGEKFERYWGVWNTAGLPKYNLIWT
jgi:exo-beta-1,3-glucanase (GH17 family)